MVSAEDKKGTPGKSQSGSRRYSLKTRLLINHPGRISTTPAHSPRLLTQALPATQIAAGRSPRLGVREHGPASCGWWAGSFAGKRDLQRLQNISASGIRWSLGSLRVRHVDCIGTRARYFVDARIQSNTAWALQRSNLMMGECFVLTQLERRV